MKQAGSLTAACSLILWIPLRDWWCLSGHIILIMRPSVGQQTQNSCGRQTSPVEMSHHNLHKCVFLPVSVIRHLAEATTLWGSNKRHVPKERWDRLKLRWRSFHSGNFERVEAFSANLFFIRAKLLSRSCHGRLLAPRGCFTSGASTVSHSEHKQCTCMWMRDLLKKKKIKNKVWLRGGRLASRSSRWIQRLMCRDRGRKGPLNSWRCFLCERDSCWLVGKQWAAKQDGALFWSVRTQRFWAEEEVWFKEREMSA